MSDVRLVNVIPVVNGWKAASLKSKGEAQTLMASGNITDYNAGLVKNAAADLAGYEVVGRIVFMDKDSGRIYR